jgi:hypothetical protein
MCWLLIRAFSDAKPTAWQLGDIVEVRPDDFKGWGREEGLPKFYRIQITGLAASIAKNLLEAVDEHDAIVDGETRKVIDGVRNWSIKPSDVPAGARTTLQTTGQLVITKAQAANFIKDNLGQAVTLP